jgi:curved DNA-binding protein CbpA
MKELHKAYNALGLEPGAPFETVKRRYRRLVLVWHPDRMTNADAKREAEEELKRINSSFEKLKKHFESEHKSGSSCRCQPAAAGSPPPSSQNTSSGSRGSAKGSGPTEEQRRDEEAATRKRNAERERKAAEEAAARRAAEATQKAHEKQQAAEDSIKSEASRKEEVLRWKCTAAIAATFIVLCLLLGGLCSARPNALDRQAMEEPPGPIQTEAASATTYGVTLEYAGATTPAI